MATTLDPPAADDADADAAVADPRPRSAVSAGTGVAGMVGLLAWVAVARHYRMDGPYAALVNLLACGLPMLAWSVLVDKVYRNPSTGIDWAAPRPWAATRAVSAVKLAGLWATWAGIAAIYATGRFYWDEGFGFAMWCFGHAAPVLFVLSIPYVLWLDRRMVEPRDGCWAFGAWLLNLNVPVDREAIFNHLRSWAVKTFFLAFMLAIVPPGFRDFVLADTADMLANPVALANWLITFMFLVDVAFATCGYVLALRPIDTHIRSANPYVAGWTAALICYPPFVLMGNGGPLDYHSGGAEWSQWFANHPALLWAIGAALVALTFVYAWATVAFGLRFSNLTNRGIITNGPYAWSRHPAYLSKNLFWWLVSWPMLVTTGNWLDAWRNTAILALVSGVYYWRARTEERHLLADPDYRAYYDWAGRNAVVPRFFARIAGK
ncbi:methyltransferase family protein [Sphingomonas sp. ac-8]|uniref:methyltransferase family protein n=1 Tax=Sphingomonas sp. ac-8 TaxID=3242977 RepID=UPI003A81015F